MWDKREHAKTRLSVRMQGSCKNMQNNDRKETQLRGVLDVAGPSAPEVTGIEASVGGPGGGALPPNHCLQ